MGQDEVWWSSPAEVQRMALGVVFGAGVPVYAAGACWRPTSSGSKKTRAHAERIERNLTGKREYSKGNEHQGNELWDGTHNMKLYDSAEAITGPFKRDLVNASREHGFSISISRTMKTHEAITAHKRWTRLNITEKAAFLATCGQGAGATWAETAPEQGMPDDAWKMAARRRLRLCVEECRIRVQRGTTRWRAKRGHEYTTESATVYRDNFEDWVQLPTSRGRRDECEGGW